MTELGAGVQGAGGNVGGAKIVFGGGGFIGSHLLRFLATRGESILYSVDIREPKIRIDGVHYIRGDVRNLSEMELPSDVSVIYNFAAVHTTPGHDTHEYYETNICGATEITAFARRLGVKRIVFTSSISVYGPSEETKSEQTLPSPVSAYGWSKWLSERIHRAWLDETPDRQLVICRPAVIFGHGEGGNFTRLSKLLKGGFFIYPGRRDTIKACFYVEDLVAAIEYALSLNQRYILFNGTYPDRYTIEQIVKTLKSIAFPNAKEIMVPRWVVTAAAWMLQPFSVLQLGIHPDRVLKLVRSTDVVPSWLTAQGKATPGTLESALRRWYNETGGRFD